MFLKLIAILFCYSFSLPLLGQENEKLFDISKVSSPIIVYAQLVIKKHKIESLGMPIVSIAGCSAVGKTQFTRALQDALKEQGIQAVILKQDDFMNPPEIIPDYILHPHLDHKKLDDVLNRIKMGELHIQKPKFDWKQMAVVYSDLDLSNADIVLFEGTYVLSGSQTYNFISHGALSIFIDAKEEDIVNWNWYREITTAVHRPARDREQFDKDIAWDMADYRKNILPSRAQADFVIEKNRNHEYWLIHIKN